ncbi:serine/threonine-protein kinase [Nocardiopsis sp. NRRL B-16309]|uniref:serine/threonine-protein kinase n=1 Tax=Nocardiopsis sp. NRRL B-16309 TaxID=1519494 RepID=UPI0006ADAC7D|nr:serine/threonine-protein kinase [Nocardiopsis sp. NRRL B-16309]KOX14215.1 serine/threonine protein kinase [Nocardiopsis sp. NRRL B-16309]
MNSSEADPGRLLASRYRLEEVLGTGGMGRVWKGTDTLLDRPVAVKELTTPANLPPHEIEVLRTRMLREARSAAQLSHPSIITVFDVAEEDGRPWIVMELVRGPSLGDLVKADGVIGVGRASGIGEQMAAGLAEAHGRGIVHRDVKPGNVLIAGNDRAVLTDFGIAHLDGSTHLTSTGLLIGSPSYLAPEVAQGQSATPASDLWSLGVTLYQAVEGALPFDRPTPMATLTAIVTQDLPEAERAGALRPLLEALCEKRPEDRPTVAEARARLREVRDAEEAAGSAPAVAPTLATTAPADLSRAEEADVAEAASAAPSGGVPGESTGADGTAEAAMSAGTPAEASAGRLAKGAAAVAGTPAGPPAPSSASARGAARGGRSGRRALLVVAAVLVLLVAGATASVLVSMNRPGAGSDAGLVDGSQEAGADAGGDSSAAESEADAAGGAGADDADEPVAGESEEADEPEEVEESDDEWDFLVRHDDPSGFSVDVPEDWTEERRDHMVYFHNPDGGYLLVDQTDDPNPDAGDDWREFEPSARDRFGGYELTGIEDVEADWADDYVSAADWEFTYDGSGGRMHAINRGFHTEDKGYALFLVASNDDPEANRALLDRMSRTFEPAA